MTAQVAYGNDTCVDAAADGALRWDLLDDAIDARFWNGRLLGARDYSVFQSFGWGEFKRRSGWQPLRCIGYAADGRIAGIAQVLVKRLPLGFGVGWCPGGPAIDFGADFVTVAAGLGELAAAVARRVPRLVLRLDSYVPQTAVLVDALSREFHRPVTRISSGRSIGFDISGGVEAFVKQMTSKHRYYLRKANAVAWRWEAGSGDSDVAALLTLHREMSTRKGLKAAAMSDADHFALRDALGHGGMTILTGYLDDRPVTSCLTLDFGAKAFYLSAATGPHGRRLGAGYAMLPQLVDVLQRKGVVALDFGGVSPDNPDASGVDHFKRGFGGRPLAYLGEWEWASMPLLAPALGTIMKLRGIAP